MAIFARFYLTIEMINRVLIRSKVLQMAYAYYQNSDRDLRAVEKEFNLSLEKSYELYHYLLMLVPAIRDYAAERIELGRNKYLPTPEEQHPNTRFIDNRLARQLSANIELDHFAYNHSLSWAQQEGLIKQLYDQISGSPAYTEYMAAESCSYEDDKELWRKIFKQTLSDNDLLAEALEEHCLYWNDDLDIVISFVIKTIKRFEESQAANQPLLPMFKDESDREFARQLFHNTIINGSRYRDIIMSVVKNWELERLALMDLLILQIALAEIMDIPDIPLNVSFNEYIDLAKLFSTEKSGLFINGTLDTIVQQLKQENKLFKN